MCAETKWPNQTKYVNDSRCNSDCQPIPTPPKPPPAYEIPAQQFGFTEVPNPATGEAVYLFVGLRFGSAPTKNHDFQYWEPLRFDDDGFAGHGTFTTTEHKAHVPVYEAKTQVS